MNIWPVGTQWSSEEQIAMHALCSPTLKSLWVSFEAVIISPGPKLRPVLPIQVSSIFYHSLNASPAPFNFPALSSSQICDSHSKGASTPMCPNAPLCHTGCAKRYQRIKPPKSFSRECTQPPTLYIHTKLKLEHFLLVSTSFPFLGHPVFLRLTQHWFKPGPFIISF